MTSGGPRALQTSPYSRLMWPNHPTGPTVPVIYNVETAQSLPSVAKAVAVYTGMIKQMPMDDVRGIDILKPRPRLLEQPDPFMARALFVELMVEDYLLHGNAIALITARDKFGWPAAVKWLPAAWITIMWTTQDPEAVKYYAQGSELPSEDVIHVRRGADRWCPPKGVGVVEKHLKTLNRVGAQEEYESRTLSEHGVPSVAIITPNPSLSSEEADKGKEKWMEKFGGPSREPAILPQGTLIQPLAWSPVDADLVEARKISLIDVANMFNLDSYWLNAPTDSMTYRSPGPLYLNLLRVSLEPVLAIFEDTWSTSFLPRGRRVRFNRAELLHDDLQTTVETMNAAVSSGLYTLDEARAYMGLPPLPAAAAPPVPEPSE